MIKCKCGELTIFADGLCSTCYEKLSKKESRKKIAAVRLFRSSVSESTRNEGQQCRRGDCIERRQCNYLLKLLLGRKPTKQEIDQALHLEDMD